MTALQARVAGVNNAENQQVQTVSAFAGKDTRSEAATRRNRRRTGLYKPVGQNFPLFHAWRP